jgi:hypothetical protein
VSTAARLVVAADALPMPGWRGFARGVARRITWRSVLISALVFWLVTQIRDMGANFGAPPRTEVEPPELVTSYLVLLVCCWFFLFLAVLVGDDAVARGAPRVRSYSLAVVGGAAFGASAQYAIRLPFGLRTMVSQEEFLVRITQPMLVFLDFLILGALVTFVYVNLRTARRAAARHHAAELARLEARRRTLESRLQAMQARVEPQFLFNTLAQVGRLYESDAALAGKMLDDLIAYLRAALPHLRESSSTLGKEAALARAYLDIVRVRLGERLAFDIVIPDALADARMPPMMLLPLIDHVLVYGLETSHAGGSIRVATSTGDGKLRLAITDSGAGFVPGGRASDLDSIGERLHALYGDAATLRLKRMQEQGTQAILEIPYETTKSGDPSPADAPKETARIPRGGTP